MYQKKNNRFCNGAVLLLIAAIWNYISPISGNLRSLFLLLKSTDSQQALQIILSSLLISVLGGLFTFIPLLILSIRLLRRKHDNGNGAIAIVLAALSLLGLMLSLGTSLLTAITGTVLRNPILSELILLIFYILFALLCFDSVKPKPGTITRLWSLPGIVYGIQAVVRIFERIVQQLSIYPQIPDAEIAANFIGSILATSLPPAILCVIGWLLIGKWHADPRLPGTALPQPDMAMGTNGFQSGSSDTFHPEF